MAYCVLEYNFVKNINWKRVLTIQKREANGLTQIDLAKKLSISQTVISKIETCERRLDVIELMTVCEAIEIPFMDFINEFNKKIK